MTPCLSIIVPTFNRRDKLFRLINSIRSSVKCEYELIVVDDCSTDGTEEMIKQNFPYIRYFRHDSIQLVAKSRNDGINNSQCEYLFFIDDDNVLLLGTVESLLKQMEDDPSIGVLAPVSCYLSAPNKVMYAGVKFDRFHLISRFLFVKQDFFELADKIVEIDKAANSYMIRREAAIEVGLIDYPRYPWLDEDGELIYKIKLNGYKTLTLCKARVLHDVPYDEHINREKLREFRPYYLMRAKLFFIKDFSTGMQKPLGFVFALSFVYLYYAYLYVLPSRTKRMQMLKALTLGLIDGLVGNEWLRYL